MGESEIHQLHVPELVDHQVFRLQVPVHDTLRMGLIKAIADLACHVDSLAEIERTKAIQHMPQALALNKLHRNEGGSFTAVEVVNTTNVLVCNSSREPEFVFQTLDERRLIRDFRSQYLEGKNLSRFAIICFANNAHAAHCAAVLNLRARNHRLGSGGAH